MGFFWTTALESAVNGAYLEVADGPVNVKVHLMARAPHLTEDIPASYRSTGLFTSLTDLAGWEEVSDPGYSPVTVSANIVNDGNNFFLSPTVQSIPFAMDRRNQVEAIVYTMTSATLTGGGVGDYVVFATGTPFIQRTIVNDGDGIYALDDNTATVPWLFGWAQSTGLFATATEGPIAIRQGAPEFESSRLQHLWMRPQRVNYIANPSFEYSGGYWQSNLGPLTRVASSEGGATSYAGTATFYATPQEITVGNVHAGVATASGEAMSLITSGLTDPGPATALLEVQAEAYDASVLTSTEVLPQYAPDNRIYLRSAAFYPTGPNLTFQVKARGVGTARVGIVYYTRDYSEQTGDWGLKEDQFFQEWVLATDHDIDMQGIRTLTDRAYEASLVIEVRGYMDNYEDPDTWVWIAPEITIDQALVEEGTLLGWPYFDGDTTYGADGDFTWYGPDDADKVGKSYSLWYNDRKNIAGRLFARRVDDTALYTSYDEVQDSLLTEWVPAGTTIVPHWGVLGPNDPQFLPVDNSADILPLEVWPEQVQPFEVFEVLSLTENATQLQTAHVLLTGLGPHPITRAFVRTLPSGIVTPVTVTAGYTNDPAIVAEHFDAVAKYDFTTISEYVLSWQKAGALNETNVLYLERGDSRSPQSYLSYELLSAASAGFTEALAEALDATVDVASGSEAVAVAAASYAATAILATSAEQADVAAAALNAGTTTTAEAVEMAAASGEAFTAAAVNGIFTVPDTAAATGAGQDATVAPSPTAGAATATGVAQDATAATAVDAPAGQAAATGVANDSTTTLSLTGAVPPAEPNYAVSSGAAYDGSTDVVNAVTSLIATSITSTTATIDWADAVVTNPAASGARYEVQVGTWSGPDANGNYTPVSTTAVGYAAGTDSFLNVSGLDENISYSYGVRVHNASGAVSAWKVVTFTASNANPTFTGPSLSVASLTTINVSWSTTETDIASWNVACTGQTTQTGLASGTRSTSFTGLAYSTSYTVTVTAVDTGGLTTSQNASITTGANPDTTDPTPTITSFQPETSYGRMVLRWTNGTDIQTYLASVEVQTSPDNSVWTAVVGDNLIAGLTYSGDKSQTAAGGAQALAVKTYAEPAAADRNYVRVRCTDKAGNVSGWVTGDYVLIPTPINISATGTNQWRNTNGGQWGGTGNQNPYQWYFSDPNLNAIGAYFFSNNISKYRTTYNGTTANGNGAGTRIRTCTSMRQFFIRSSSTGSSVGHTPVMQLHKIVSNPGNVTNYAQPTLYGSQVSTGLSLGFSANGYWTLPTGWRDGLFDGSYEGTCHRDTVSGVYARYEAITDNSLSGYIEINHLG